VIPKIAIIIFVLCLGLFSTNSRAAGSDGHEPGEGRPVPVALVDLERYIGQWYEIAKIPNRFQRKCSRGTTATYALRDDGMIEVVNRCTVEDGGTIDAKGVARVVDSDSRAKLEVSFVRLFGLQLFWGDYWIIGLEKDYQYAVVGHPDRRYGWVLARRKALTPDQWAEVHAILKDNGYDPDDFEMTLQADAAHPE
jgi:apolipoprotein D and lipocalin family protein